MAHTAQICDDLVERRYEIVLADRGKERVMNIIILILKHSEVQ